MGRPGSIIRGKNLNAHRKKFVLAGNTKPKVVVSKKPKASPGNIRCVKALMNKKQPTLVEKEGFNIEKEGIMRDHDHKKCIESNKIKPTSFYKLIVSYKCRKWGKH